MDIPVPARETAASPVQGAEAVAGLLQAAGRCDARTLDRGRRVAAETGQRLDRVLIQLGLVSERELATSYAELLGCDVTRAERYPADPLLAERLTPRFLRHARAMPVELGADFVVVAMADPLDGFTPAAIAAAVGRTVRIEVAVPIELEAAFGRLYPDQAVAAESVVEDTAAEASEDDADRLKDLASEAPVIRLVNQIISRAVETQASDIHLEPFEDQLPGPLPLRRRMLHEVERPAPAHMTPAPSPPASRSWPAWTSPSAACRRTAASSSPCAGTEVDFRVSTIPSLHGETVVLRVLDRSAVVF